MRAASCRPDFGFLPRQCKMRCATPSFFASRLTATASRAASARRPWSTVIAMSFGARLSRFAQRAARTNSAVESGPPETARINPRAFSRPLNTTFASSSRTACSAVGTLLFPVHVLLHRRRSLRIFAQDFAERRAGSFLFTERRERLTEPHQRLRRARGGFVFGRDRQEGFSGFTIMLILKQRFAEPILRLGGQAVARIFLQKIAQRLFGRGVVLVQHIAIDEIEFVFGRVAGRQRGPHSARWVSAETVASVE